MSRWVADKQQTTTAQISLWFLLYNISMILYLPSLNRWFYGGKAYRGSNKWCSSGLIQVVAHTTHKAVGTQVLYQPVKTNFLMLSISFAKSMSAITFSSTFQHDFIEVICWFHSIWCRWTRSRWSGPQSSIERPETISKYR